MYMAYIPTYNVSFSYEKREIILRVSQNDLEKLLSVLIFNRIEEFHVLLEDGPIENLKDIP